MVYRTRPVMVTVEVKLKSELQAYNCSTIQTIRHYEMNGTGDSMLEDTCP